ncbi:CCA tRNA nucleotidyltransferase [Candidatus Woesearchaeota archaeon]|nr:CCA tRNA nucleotidyltransferase [Candidatus Woesearchaeota archaeon]
MKNIKALLDEVLLEIQPDKKYEKEIFERLGSIIKKINRGRKGSRAILGGSGAKGTWLRTFDADIFVLFDYKKFREKSDKLPDILEKILRKKFRNIARLHGSRDYFQIKDNDFTFEIIPILKIQKAEQARNITDVSPLHSNWVKKHKNLINEMKLTKQFCQAQNVYGAESYIRGFSGYVCEILTVHYGSFLGLMRNAAKWQDKAVIDAEKHYKGKDVFRLVNVSKLESPLIVIDPVQKDRNAAAALSKEKFEAFQKAAKEFLKKPSKEFFGKKELLPAFLRQKTKEKKLAIAKIRPLSGKTDVVGTKLLKIYELVKQQLQKNNFRTTKTDWEWDKKNDAIFYFLFDRKPLAKTFKFEGPPVRIKQHAENFKKAHKKTFVKDGKIYAIEKRKFTHPEGLLNSIIKNQFVKERSKSAKTEIL